MVFGFGKKKEAAAKEPVASVSVFEGDKVSGAVLDDDSFKCGLR